MFVLNLKDFRIPCLNVLSKRHAISRRRPGYPPGKPKILPPAKTKRYMVKNVRWQTAEDVREFVWKRSVYMDALSSIRYALKQEQDAIQQSKAKEKEALEKSVVDELEQILIQNEEENKVQATKREQRKEEELAVMELKALAVVERYLTITEKEKARREKEVLQIIEHAKDFVTPENVDEKIDQVLETLVDHDFCIDTEGNMFVGNRHKKYLEELFLIETNVSLQSAPTVKSGKLEKVVDTTLRN